jgi:hypothetical protein
LPLRGDEFYRMLLRSKTIQPPLSHKKCGVLISKNAAFCKTLYFTISIPAAVSSSFFVDFFIILYTPTVRRGTR